MTRLIDEFANEAINQNIRFPSEPEIVSLYGDLCWDIQPSQVDYSSDPAFIINSDVRHVAFQRILGEIRFYAAPLATNLVAPENLVRHEGFDGPQEFGVIGSVYEAVSFAFQYLRGESLDAIEVRRFGFAKTPRGNLSQ
jgi:hypothetical protein